MVSSLCWGLRDLSPAQPRLREDSEVHADRAQGPASASHLQRPQRSLCRRVLYSWVRVLDGPTNDPRLGGLEHRLVFSQFWRPETEVRVSAEPRSLRRLQGMVLPEFSSFWGLQTSLGCGRIPPVSASIFTSLSPLLSNVSPLLSLKGHLSLDLGPPPKTRMISL